jgi:rhodanese-related sulfurtransferase
MTNESTIRTIDCRELHGASVNGPIELIDVRSFAEFQEIRAAGARNVPLDTFDPAAVVRSRVTPPDQPLYLICAVGARSAWACELMIAAGYDNVVNVEGGTQAWYLAGLPIQQGT